jgi:hypothetical protein
MRRFVWLVAEYLEASQPVKEPLAMLINGVDDTGSLALLIVQNS